MRIFAILFFLIAILFGILLLRYVLMNKTPPKHIAIIHGTCAVLGFLTIAFMAFFHPSMWSPVIFFALVASGGVYMFVTAYYGKKIPKYAALAHGSFAILAFCYLLYCLEKL